MAPLDQDKLADYKQQAMKEVEAAVSPRTLLRDLLDPNSRRRISRFAAGLPHRQGRRVSGRASEGMYSADKSL